MIRGETCIFAVKRAPALAEIPISNPQGEVVRMFSAIAIALAVACVVGAYSLLRDALDEVW